MKMPKTLEYRGRIVNLAGEGRIPGSYVYVDAGAGQTVELYLLQVVQRQTDRGLARPVGNRSLPSVCLGPGTMNGSQPGDFLLAALSWGQRGPAAVVVWPIRSRHRRPEMLGVVVEARRTWGKIQPIAGGQLAFFKLSKCPNGFIPRAGSQVRFSPVPTSRGLAASNVVVC